MLAPNRHSRNKVLLITEWDQTQSVFQDLGCKVHVIHFSMLLHGAGTNAQDMLRRGHDFMLVWIDLPSRRTLDTHRACAVRRWGFIKQIVETAVRTTTPAVIYGPSGKVWNIDALQALLHEGRVSSARHHWCHFGIRLHDSNDLPS